MAQYLDKTGLTHYDQKIKEYIDSKAGSGGGGGGSTLIFEVNSAGEMISHPDWATLKANYLTSPVYLYKDAGGGYKYWYTVREFYTEYGLALYIRFNGTNDYIIAASTAIAYQKA